MLNASFDHLRVGYSFCLILILAELRCLQQPLHAYDGKGSPKHFPEQPVDHSFRRVSDKPSKQLLDEHFSGLEIHAEENVCCDLGVEKVVEHVFPGGFDEDDFEDYVEVKHVPEVVHLPEVLEHAEVFVRAGENEGEGFGFDGVDETFAV